MIKGITLAVSTFVVIPLATNAHKHGDGHDHSHHAHSHSHDHSESHHHDHSDEHEHHKHEKFPTFRIADVQREATENKKLWVTYKDGVYDLTTFADSHPGGVENILMAAGGPIEPFWKTYPFHEVEKIIDLLKSNKIGVLHKDDIYHSSSHEHNHEVDHVHSESCNHSHDQQEFYELNIHKRMVNEIIKLTHADYLLD